jgi:site-specific DNA recombinase
VLPRKVERRKYDPSPRLLQQELEAHGIAGKSWTSASGRSWGGKPLGRGALYLILRNRIYCGDIVHRDKAYSGEHAAIIDPELWASVQARLAENAVERSAGLRVKNPSLLAGLLFDSEGQRMTPTHAVKNGKRYRYYVSRPLIIGSGADVAAGLRLPAAEIEQITTNRIRRLLSEPASLFEMLKGQVGEAMLQQNLMARAAKLVEEWPRMSPLRRRVVLVALVRRVDIFPHEVIIQLRPHRLAALLDDCLAAANPTPVADEPTLPLSRAAPARKSAW